MPYTIYAKMKRMGRQRKEELTPVRFELEKKAGYGQGIL